MKPTLARLLVAFQRAIQLREYEPLDGDRLEREAKELIGDFNATLTECREILEDNRGIIKDGAGFVQNVIWGTSTQTRVDELRKRIQLHIQKIELFMGSVRLEQSNTIVDGIQEILYHARELRGLSSDTVGAHTRMAPLSIPRSSGHQSAIFLHRHWQYLSRTWL